MILPDKTALVEHYANGQLEWRIPLEWNGPKFRRHGEAIQYYPTGQVKLRRIYEHGVEKSETIYHRDGSIYSERVK